MNDRRSLIEGLNPGAEPDRSKEQAFVYGHNAKPALEPTPEVVQPVPSAPPIAKSLGRSPVSTRIRTDYAEALKKASLERQLKGEAPNTVQDILEEALESWFKQHGYID